MADSAPFVSVCFYLIIDFYLNNFIARCYCSFDARAGGAVPYLPQHQASGLVILSCRFGKEPRRKQKALTPRGVFPRYVQSSERDGRWCVAPGMVS